MIEQAILDLLNTLEGRWEGTSESLIAILSSVFGQMSPERLSFELKKCTKFKVEKRKTKTSRILVLTTEGLTCHQDPLTCHPQPATEGLVAGQDQSNSSPNLVNVYYEQTPARQADLVEEATRFLGLISTAGEVGEIRCLPSGSGQIYAGTFTSPGIAAKAAVALNGKFKGTYFTLNPVQLEATNTIVASTNTAKDEHVTRRRWLLVDIEAGRPKDTNATDHELEQALMFGEHLASKIKDAKPIALLSGNGCHLLYRLDLPHNEQITALIRSALRGLANLYPWEGASLDTKVFNAARISKLPGTLTKKGVHTAERPQRIARVLYWGVEGTLSQETLQLWASHDTQPTTQREPAPEKKATPERPAESDWQSKVDPKERAAMWLAKRDPAITGTGTRDNWTYETCGYMVRGFALSISDAMEVLQEWNQRCIPAWPHDQLWKKCEHALKYGKQPFGEMLWQKPTKRYVSDEVINNFSQTDLGNAECVLKIYGNRLIYNLTRGQWLIWSGRHWAEDDKHQLLAWVNKAARKRKDAAESIEDEGARKAARAHARKSESYRSRQATIAQMEAFTPWVKASEQFDQCLWSLATENGTIDLRTGCLGPHRPDDLITKCSPIKYDPTAECPLWLEFLATAMKGDGDLVSYIQRAVGYSLTGRTNEHAVFICHGGGRNGKSVFLDIISELLGEYAVPTPSSTFTEKESDGVNNAIAGLNGARLVRCSETNQSFKLDEAIIKSLSGEDVITARFLYKEYFKFKPRFKVWLATNHKPIISGTDCGIWRRIRLIPWLNEIPVEKVDKDLGSKLQQELPGILAWAVQGCLQWQNQGLNEPQAVRAATAEYQAESDTVGGYLRECCTEDHPAAEESLAILYAGYVRWAKDQGLNKLLAKKGLNRKLKEKGFSVEERGRFKHAWVRGLKLVALPERNEPNSLTDEERAAINGFSW